MRRKGMKVAHEKSVEPTPIMARGATDFEEKLIARDFQAVFSQISNAQWHDMRSPLEFCYRAAFVAGKAARRREQGEESIGTPIDASVRETAGAQKEKQNGITTGD